MDGKSKQQGLQMTGHILSMVGRQRRGIDACCSALNLSLSACLSGFCFSVSLGFSLSLSVFLSLSLVSLYFCLSLCYLCLCLSVSLCLSIYLFVISVSLFFFLFLFLSLDQDPSHIETPTAVLSISTSKIKITLHRCAQRPISWVIRDSGELAVNPSCHRVIHLSSVSILLGYWPPDRLADELACMATVAVRMEKVSLFTSPTSLPKDI